jgi:hypothetical protein
VQNSELLTLTYGAVVAQLIKDAAGDYAEVNRQLEKMYVCAPPRLPHRPPAAHTCSREQRRCRRRRPCVRACVRACGEIGGTTLACG